jgi:hypothetical protein
VERVNYIILHLKTTGNADGQIPAFILKRFSNYLAKPIAFLVNLSIVTKKYPTCLKLYRVIPLLKSGDPFLVSNYRPISIPPPISKIFETIYHDQINDYLQQNNIIVANQFGFKSNSSTAIPISLLADKLKEAVDQDKIPLAIFLDFRKAFDSMSVPILFKKN